MATTNQGWALPTVGGSQDTWGTTLNTTIQAIDTLVGTVTATEISYLDNVTSNIQTQLNAKAGLSGANFTGAVDVNATLTANALAIDNGASDWSFEIESNVLYFKYAGTKKAKLDSSGNLTVIGNITAYGTM